MARTCVRPVPEELNVRPLAIYGVEGHLHRRNDAVILPALRSRAVPGARAAKQRTLVFFGGDIQNLEHLMDQTDEEIDYRLWCLEATALRLAGEFPSCHVVVIKPSRVVFEHISCYDNFVESNSLGIATHCYHYMSLMHLEKLLENISETLRQRDSDVLFKMLLRTELEEKYQDQHEIVNGTAWQFENLPAERKRMLRKWQKTLRLQKYPLTLVAFSKGCVVLNQFLYEFHYARGLEPHHQDSRFIELIRDMYWLDAGNCGRQNVYATSRGLLRTLAVLKIHVHVHVSLYMTEDENRPWIKKQLNEFLEGIDAAKGRVTHFRHASPTEDLKSHFRVLLQFKDVEKNGNNINSLNVRLPRNLSSPEEPAPVAPQPVRPRLRSKHPCHNETVLGICLEKPHNTPHLGLRVAFQKPGTTLKATEGRLYCYHPTTQVEQFVPGYRETPSANQMPVIPTQLISAQIPPTPSEPSTFAQMPSTLSEPLSYAEMPSTPAEPSTSAQKPPTPTKLWPDLLPRNERYSVLLLNDKRFAFNSRAEQMNFHELYSRELYWPVVAFPHYRNSSRVHVYTPEKETYVPTVNNHHQDVNSKNRNDDLHSFFVDEEPLPAADDLNPGRATSNNATDPVGLTASPHSDVSSPDSSSDGSVSDSYTSAGSDSDISDLDSQFSGSESDVSASDSDSSLSSGRSSPVDSRIGSRSDLADHLVLTERATSHSTPIAQSDDAQNRVDTPRNQIDSLSTPPGSQVASSSQDSVAPQAGSSGAKVRARDVDDELPSRYNLRKKIKRSYDENILFPY